MDTGSDVNARAEQYQNEAAMAMEKEIAKLTSHLDPMGVVELGQKLLFFQENGCSKRLGYDSFKEWLVAKCPQVDEKIASNCMACFKQAVSIVDYKQSAATMPAALN